jgi:hypothetical protein
LWFITELTGGSVRLLCRVEVTTEPVHLTLTVEGTAARQPVEHSLAELFGGRRGLGERSRPVAESSLISARWTRHRPLCAIISGWRSHHAVSADRPFAHVPELEGGCAERNRVAVNDAGHDRRQLIGVSHDQRFVDQPECIFSPAESQQRSRLLIACKPDQIGVAEPGANGLGLDGRPEALVEQPASHLFEPHGRQQIAPLETVHAGLVDDALRPREPSSSAGPLATERKL